MRVVISCAATGFNGLGREILRLRNARWDRRQTFEHRSWRYRRAPDAAERRDIPANLTRRTACLSSVLDQLAFVIPTETA
jgi:hypothetical protein